MNGKGKAQARSHASLFVVKTETPVKETPEPQLAELIICSS